MKRVLIPRNFYHRTLITLCVASAFVLGSIPTRADDGAETEQTQLAADVYPTTPPKNLDLYLVIGQSNMAGRANIRAEDQAALDRVYLFTGDPSKAWAVATNPLNRHSTIRKKISMQRLSPAYSFAKEMSAANPGKQIGLVMNARGGTSITQWLPGTAYFKIAVARTRDAMKYGSLKGIIWHQGESDCQGERLDMYLDRMQLMISGFREAFGNQDLPLVAGELFATAKRKRFNQTLTQLPHQISNTAVASSQGTSTLDGSPPETGTHFDSASQILIGTRYAQQMLKLHAKHK